MQRAINNRDSAENNFLQPWLVSQMPYDHDKGEMALLQNDQVRIVPDAVPLM